MYEVTLSHDGLPAHWSRTYKTFDEAVKSYETFKDWGFSDKYATITLIVNGERSSKTFHRPKEAK
jgi:hypothetical protein